MNIINKNDDYKIYQDNLNSSIYKIEFITENMNIINSIVNNKFLLGATISSDYKILKFKANSVKTFEQYKSGFSKADYKISTEIIVKILSDLVLQLKYLIENQNYAFLGYNINNLIVIDDKKFIYLSSEYLNEINDNKIKITFPFFSKDFYFSPELEYIYKLPSKVHFKVSYYSLACLIIRVMKGNDDFYNKNFIETHKTRHESIIDQLELLHIKETKFYWLLKRCLDIEPENRSIIFI